MSQSEKKKKTASWVEVSQLFLSETIVIGCLS